MHSTCTVLKSLLRCTRLVIHSNYSADTVRTTLRRLNVATSRGERKKSAGKWHFLFLYLTFLILYKKHITLLKPVGAWVRVSIAVLPRRLDRPDHLAKRDREGRVQCGRPAARAALSHLTSLTSRSRYLL